MQVSCFLSSHQAGQLSGEVEVDSEPYRTSVQLHEIQFPGSSSWEVAHVAHYTAYVWNRSWSSACSSCSNTKHFSMSLFCKSFYSGWSSTPFSYLCQAFQKLECGSKALLIKELRKAMGSYKGIYYSPDNSVLKAHVPRELSIWHDSNPSSFITEALLLHSVLKKH